MGALKVLESNSRRDDGIDGDPDQRDLVSPDLGDVKGAATIPVKH